MKFYTPDQLAARWRCTTRTVRSRVRRGEIPEEGNSADGRRVKYLAIAIHKFERDNNIEVTI